MAGALEAADAARLYSDMATLAGSEEGRLKALRSAGELWLLLGDFSDASDAFEKVANGDEGLVLHAARLWLAAGENDRAGRLAALVLASSKDAERVDEARLVAAWAALFGGSPASARALASTLVPTQKATQRSTSSLTAREALFLLWAASPVADRDAAAKSLVAAFPGSLEARAAAQDPLVSLRVLPHWYFGAADLSRPQVSPVTASAMSDTPPSAAPLADAAPSSPGKSQRFQIGIFSRKENADSLMAELRKKGFSPRLEERRVSGQGLLAVVVEGGAKESDLGARLKNAGYEAWPLFQ
jgi:hypothetical protein